MSRSRLDEPAAGSVVERTELTSPILVMHWGRSGGGPRFAVRMAEALRGKWPGAVYVSLNRDAEILGLDDLQLANTLPVTTYRTVWGLVLCSPRLCLLGMRMRRLLKRRGVTTVYSAMSSLWQTVCTFFFLPRSTMFVASIHDAAEHPGEQHWALRLCRNLELRRADVVVVHSVATKDALEPRLARRNTRIVVIPHGADAPTAQPRRLDGRGDTPLRLGFVGRIVEYKGLGLFIDLIRSLTSEGMNVRGIVAGRGDVPASVVESTSAIIDWRIGWIPESGLPQVMDEIDVLVLPYREASQSGVHGLALSAGVPTVATPVGGLIEQVEDTQSGVVAHSVSVEALADAVRTLVEPHAYALASERCLLAAGGSSSWRQAASLFVAALKADA
ncbi:glycosyltransferase family 4 protein [Glaciibacter sp. 2TAF33]|uniref:glycosyltransferase family 4 protein n=1 Tax=Glaciibacter sp. 2TAF33 TaxID=3233015 RepID=UPI003F8FAF99